MLAGGLASCSSDSAPMGSGGSTSSGGSAADAGSSAKAGSTVAGASTGGAGANAGSAGSATTGSGGTAVGGGAGATSSGNNAGGNNAGAAGTGGAAGAGGAADPTGVAVRLDSPKQTIDGFGINDTFATETMTAAIADSLFTTQGDGIGLTMLRIGMKSSGGFMSNNMATDMKLARERGAKIIGSCWSPPAADKDNNKEIDGGHLKPGSYEKWATTIAKFAKDNDLYAMSIGNEPDFASCGSVEPCNGNYETTLYTANELVAFARVAGPKLQAVGVKAIVGEASEWIHMFSNESATGSYPSKKNSSDPLKCGFPPTNPVCSSGGGYDYAHYLAKDPVAWAAVDILGVHEYDTQRAEPWPSDIPSRKPVWQTEMSGVKWWPEEGPSSDIGNGVAVAEWIHSALVVGDASAWFWWFYRAYYTDDNEGLFIQKNGTNAWTDTRRHYTFGNYSKFIRPGYTRVDISGSIPASVLLSAYKGPDGTLVVVAINKGSAKANVPITVVGGAAPAMLTPWVTSATEDLKSRTAIAVTGGSFSAALDSLTVTTFVGK